MNFMNPLRKSHLCKETAANVDLEKELIKFITWYNYSLNFQIKMASFALKYAHLFNEGGFQPPPPIRQIYNER